MLINNNPNTLTVGNSMERCPIIPIPAVCNVLDGECPVSTTFTLCTSDASTLAPVAELLTTALTDLSFAVVDGTCGVHTRNASTQPNSAPPTCITMSVTAVQELPMLAHAAVDSACLQAGYELHVDAKVGISIRAPSPTGVLHGAQSLLQLLMPCSPAVYGCKARAGVACMQV